MTRFSRALVWATLALALAGCPAEETSSGNNGFGSVCDSPFELCGESCVDTGGDPFHCGGCDVECGEAEHCRFGKCREVEDCREEGCEGLSVCDETSGRCVPGCTSNGQCGNRGEFCDADTMRCTCDPAEHLCAGRCADDTATATCGDRCTPCPTDPNGSAACDGGECGLDCAGGFLDCEGACAACPDGAGAVVCDGATCVATECEGDDTLICDNVCATCPRDQVASVTCDGTSCVPESCSPQFHVCADACVDSTSVNTCGDACSPCPTDPNGTASCRDGRCEITCDDDTRQCDGACARCPTDSVRTTACQADRCIAATCTGAKVVCGGLCATCPTVGVTQTECDGTRCVAASCEEGRLACGGACAECPVENVAEVACNGSACRATACFEGAMLCGSTCSVCPSDDSVGSLGCSGEVCIATSCAEGYVQCPDGCCQWRFAVADTAVGVNGYDVSVAVGEDGVVHATHANISLQDLRYGALDGDRWTFESADEGPSRGRSSSVALGPDGAPSVSYRDDTGDMVVFATKRGEDWDVEIVDAADPWDTTGLGIDADGVPHVAYNAFLLNLRYATRPTDTWIVDEIAPRGDKVTLTLDDGGEPWVCYSTGVVRCASRAANWAPVDVGRTANLTFPHPQLSAVWHDGALWVAYRDTEESALVLARVAGNRVTKRLVDGGDGAGTAVGLGFDTMGNAHIAYTVMDVGVRYARGTTEFEVSDVMTAPDTDEYVAIGLEPDGTPHVLFQSGTQLMHATF